MNESKESLKDNNVTTLIDKGGNCGKQYLSPR